MMIEQAKAQQAIDQAAEAIAVLPVPQWGPLVVNLLEQLDAKTSETLLFKGACDLILDALLNRAYLGRW